MSRLKRRAVISAAVVAAALLAGGLTLAFTGGSGQAGDVTYLGGGGTSAWLYQPAHRPAAPAFTGRTLTGDPVSLADFRGKVVVLNFWGSWCPPCRGEAPALAALSERYHGSVSFLGDDVGDNPATALAFTHDMGIKYPSMDDPGYQVAQNFGKAVLVNDTPTTLVLDRTGNVAGVIYGIATYSVLNTMIKDVAR